MLGAIGGKEIRCVIIEAQGDRAFSTGHDLREVASTRDYAFHHALLTHCSAMMLSIKRLPQPVIAKVQAIATAAGCQLVASCDLAICTDTSAFCTPGVNLGLFCSTPMVTFSTPCVYSKIVRPHGSLLMKAVQQS